ncbi:MAG: LVIVD repeat-containing protein [Actinomycetota bacterium]
MALSVIPASVGAQALPPDPVPTSENLRSLGRLAEGVGAISLQFSSDTPHMYLSTLKGIQIYDISDPKAPQFVSAEPLPHYQNEAMSLGERKNGDKFLLIASNQAGVALNGDATATNRFIWVMDVTDPANPEVVSSLATDSRTHTVSCLTKSCEYAYSDGRTQGFISIIDLRDLMNPKMAGTYESVVPQGHDQDLDAAGLLWHVGGQGAVALDVSKPTKPVPLNSTNPAGVGNADRENSPYNNFILHNSARPNAKNFKAGTAPNLKNGNILLATEEDTGSVCGPDLGGFSTWHIPFLDAAKYKKTNPKLAAGGGTIAPLDMWYPEDVAVGHACSAHYFDYSETGLVTQGWYELGTRILDVRDPNNIKQIGFFFGRDMETWASYWVPARDAKGKVTGKDTNIIYSADVSRGVDILEFTPLGKSAKETRAVVAPTFELPTPFALGVTPSKRYGYLCRIASRL